MNIFPIDGNEVSEIIEDTVIEIDGEDTIDGSLDDDNLSGGMGDNTINGEAGDDTLSGGMGNDTLSGAIGNDSISGDMGNDRISGAAGNDSISGGMGNDTIAGGDGSDSLYGEMGNDSLSGRAGDDYLIADLGQDTLTGGADADTFFFIKPETETSESDGDVVVGDSEAEFSQSENLIHTITDFDSAEGDIILIDGSSFEITESDIDTIEFNNSTGILSIGGEAAIEIVDGVKSDIMANIEIVEDYDSLAFAPSSTDI